MKESQSLPSTMLESIEETNPEVTKFSSVLSLKQDIQQSSISHSIKESLHHSHPLEIISDSSNDAFTFICTHPQLYLSSSPINKTESSSIQSGLVHKNDSLSFQSVKSDMNESSSVQPVKSTKRESLMVQPATSTERESLSLPTKSNKRESLTVQPATSTKRESLSIPTKSNKRESLSLQPAKSNKRESISSLPSTSKKHPRTTLTEEVSTSSSPPDKPFPCLFFILFTHT